MAVPSASAGSSIPQCAVIGWPGHTGQDSPAALSQTVKTKSIAGASGLLDFFPPLLAQPVGGVVEAVQNLDRERIHRALRLAAGGERAEVLTAVFSQDRLGKYRTG